MIDTIIVSGGNIQNGFALDFLRKNIEKAGRENLRLIAADKGLEFFMEVSSGKKELFGFSSEKEEFFSGSAELGLLPDIAVGDFDSLSEKGKLFLSQQEELGNMEIIRLKPEKDDSDTQSAAVLAMNRGSRDIVILGGTGTRLDHVLANLGLLSLGWSLGAHISLVDENNYITLLENGTILKRNEQFGKYVSFFPVGGDVGGLTLKGFQYPLSDYCLTVSDSGLTVSNEIAEETAEITYESGVLLMIMSRD